MKKKLIALNTTIMIGLGSVFSIPAVQAESSISNIQSERAGIQSEIANAEKIIQDFQAEQTKLHQQIEQIKDAIKENTAKIEKTQKQTKETEADVATLKQEIAVLEERIANRQEVLKERALSFQQSGGNVDMIEVLLGSTSFSDFLGRVGAVATIVEADQEILAQQEKDKADLVEKKATIEVKLKNLKSMKVELEGMQAQIEEQKKQSENAIKKLEAKEKETAALKTSLEQKDANLGVQVAAILDEKRKEAQRKVAQEKTLNKAASEIQKPASVSTPAPAPAPASTSTSVSRSTSTSTSNNSSSNSTTSSTESKSSSANVSSAITAGYKYIGNSTYVFGGGRTASDIANGYFDCSGFVSWAYRQAGVSLPSTTDGLKYAGTQIPTNQMQPGDLVFFNTYKTDGHVGIYIGGGKFIGSQSSTGVAIANMNSGYWASTFNGRVVRVN